MSAAALAGACAQSAALYDLETCLQGIENAKISALDIGEGDAPSIDELMFDLGEAAQDCRQAMAAVRVIQPQAAPAAQLASMPPELQRWLESIPDDLAEWRASFDARLHNAFACQLSLYGLIAELQAMAYTLARPELLGLMLTCLQSVARVHTHDGLSFALLRAIRDALLIG